MIELQNVRKSFGSVQALDGLCMHVPDGCLYGFVGPNGAGKTTTFQLLLGLMYPEEGFVQIDEMEAGSQVRRLKRRIGYVPDYAGVYPNLRVVEYMDFFASCYELSGSRVRRRIQMLLDLVGLKGRERQMVDALSRGMQQKLSLARALIHDPKFLILDEPMLGLDPGTRYDFKRILAEIADEDKTVLLSSHILTEISEICTHVGIIDHGRMVVEGELSEVLQMVNASNPIVITIEGPLTGAMRSLKADRKVRSISARGQEILISYDGSQAEEAALLRELVQNDVPIRGFHREQGNLEALFLQLTGTRQERTITGYEAESHL